MMTIKQERKDYRIENVPSEIAEALKSELSNSHSIRGIRYYANESAITFLGNVNDIIVVRRVVAGFESRKAKAEAETVNTNAPRRASVKAGSVTIGDIVGGFVVTGLGRAFVPGEAFWSTNQRPVDGSDADGSAWQYAYFN